MIATSPAAAAGPAVPPQPLVRDCWRPAAPPGSAFGSEPVLTQQTPGPVCGWVLVGGVKGGWHCEGTMTFRHVCWLYMQPMGAPAD
jgi:hypothetical protein